MVKEYFFQNYNKYEKLKDREDSKSKSEDYDLSDDESDFKNLLTQDRRKSYDFKKITVYNNGHGKYIFENGNIWEGELIDNKMIGYGKLTFKNGNILEGIFENNKIKNNGKLIKKYISESYLKNNGKLIKKNISESYLKDTKIIDYEFSKSEEIFYNLPLKIYQEIRSINKKPPEDYIIKDYYSEISINDKILISINWNLEIMKFTDKIEIINIYNDKNNLININENIDLKNNLKNLLENYNSIKYVNAMNYILEHYGKSKISNIYKFLGLPISFESKMNLLLSKRF